MGKKVSWAGKKQFAMYKNENRFAKNKRRKLEKHVKLYPDDLKAKKVLEEGIKEGFSYKRKTPKSSVWSKSDKHIVQLMHSVDGTTGKQFLDLKRDRLRVQRKDLANE